MPFVTVFSGRPEVDVSSADPTVLSAFPEMTPQILGAVLNARVKDPDDGRALLALLGPAKARATTDRSKAFRASIAVDFDNGRRVHAEVVFRLKDQGDKEQADKDKGSKDKATKTKATKTKAMNPMNCFIGGTISMVRCNPRKDRS